MDIDICQAHRAKIIDYVRQKYGHVAQIITFGTMKARAVIRDICRVLGVPLIEADRLAKLVDNLLDTSRMESGLLKLQRAPTNIHQIIESAVFEARLRTNEHRIKNIGR